MNASPIQASEASGLGAMLRHARETEGLSQLDLARQLNLSVRIVEAMEKEDRDALPGAVYVHGYLRKWAEYLQLDEQQLQQAFARLRGIESGKDLRHAAPLEPMRMKKTDASFPWGKLLLLALLVGLGFASTRFLPESMRWLEGAPQGAGDAAPAPLSDAQPLPLLPSIPLAPPVAESPAAAPAIATTPGVIVGEVKPGGSPLASDVAQPAPEAPPAAPPAGLELSGHGDAEGSWVRVKDADAQILFEGTIAPGDSKRMDGRRPFVIIIGRASDLSVKLDGQDIDLDDYARPGGKAFIPKLGAPSAQ
ncbi:MAG: RodZ domain-containing protein [Pseudomonadota bacterium]